MVGPCALWKTDSIIVIFTGHARAVLVVMKEQNTTLNHHITISVRKNHIIRTRYITFSFEETSGYVRPERANKWPNSMTDI